MERVPAVAREHDHDARAAVMLTLDIAAMEDRSHNPSRALQALEAARALQPDTGGQGVRAAAGLAH